VSSLEEAEKQLGLNADAYIKMTLYKAAANLALEDAAKKSLEAERIRLKNLQEFSNAAADSRISAGGAGGLGTGQFNAADYDQETKRIAAAQEARKNKQIKTQ